jgi:hypothetical protein
MYKHITYKHIIPYIKFKYSYYILGLSIGTTKVSSTKDALKDSPEFTEVVSFTSGTFSSP